MTLKDIYTSTEKYIKLFVKRGGKVVRKFVTDTLFGILSAKSVRISEIALEIARRGKQKRGMRPVKNFVSELN